MRKYVFLVLGALIVFALDQWTKVWAVDALVGGFDGMRGRRAVCAVLVVCPPSSCAKTGEQPRHVQWMVCVVGLPSKYQRVACSWLHVQGLRGHGFQAASPHRHPHVDHVRPPWSWARLYGTRLVGVCCETHTRHRCLAIHPLHRRRTNAEQRVRVLASND